MEDSIFTWNDLKMILEICIPILGAFWYFYNRLDNKIDRMSTEWKAEWKEVRAQDRAEWKEALKASKEEWKALDERWERLFTKLAEKN